MIGSGAEGSLPERQATAFAALGDPFRLLIVQSLCERGPLSTIGIQEGRPSISRQGVSKHLRVLEDAGLIGSVRIGRNRHWQIRAEQLVTLRRYLDSVAAEWDTRIERLRSLVESGSPEPDPGGAVQG